ncbi:MAG: glycosyltransferase family 2 protein [archaeon]
MIFKTSVIIPLHNGEKIIEKTLEGVYNQSLKPDEVIVIDDCSTDNSLDIVKKFPCKIIKLEKNSGPAVARNLGAEKAKGNILVFVDVDAVLEKHVLERMIQDYEENPEVACVCGTFSKFSRGAGWVDKFRNLQIFWWHNQDNLNKKFISIFMVTGGSIKRKIFFEMNGFDTTYADADVEDYEMGHRIVKKYKILLDKKIQFDHNHYRSPFWTLVKKLFKRSMMWVPLMLKRKSFDSNYVTPNKGLGAIFAGLSFVSLILTFFCPVFAYVFLFLFFIFILTDLKFYLFLFKEGGPLFLIYSIVIYYIFILAMSFGAGVGLISYFLKK